MTMRLGQTKTFKTKKGRKVTIHKSRNGRTRIMSNTKA